MTDSERIRATITGSFVIYLLSMLEGQDKVRGSVVKLKQALMAITTKEKNKDLVVLANEAWAKVVDKYKDENYRLVLADAVEMLVNDEIDAMEKLYGKNIGDLAYRATLKLIGNGVEPEILKESREISDSLIEATRKLTYDYLKDK